MESEMEVKETKAYGLEFVLIMLLALVFSAIWFVGAVEVGRMVLQFLGHVLVLGR